MFRHMILAAAIGSLITAPAVAQGCDHDDADGRLDVGLVLSGGGALASTHIGVLAVLEEEGVPVHCIVGTSMGSVVGGLYASGWSPDDMRAEFEAADWPRLIQNTLNRDELPFREKNDQDEYFSDYVAGWGDEGLILPSSVTTLRGLQGFYRRMLDRAPPEFDFDNLPVPFRAVATDLGTGRAVVLDHGDIVEAMLASMSVPGLFDPRQIDGRLLVDGGLSKQLPVDVARAMGADVIIVVDTTVEPSDPPLNPSVVQVAQQIVQVQVWTNRTEQAELLGPGDILIRPDLSMLSTASFERAGEGFESGVNASSPFRARMREIAAQASPPLVNPDAIAARGNGESRRVTRVEIVNNTRVSDAVIAQRFGIEAGDDVTRDDIENGITEVAGMAAFGTIDAGFQEDGTLTLRTQERPLGDNLFQAGLTVSNTFDRDSRYVLRGRYVRRPLNASGGEFAVSLALGSEYGFALEWMQPFGREGRYFTDLELGFEGYPLPLDFDGQRIDEYWLENAYVEVQAGRDFGRWGQVSLVGEYRYGEYHSDILGEPDEFGDVRLDIARYGARFEIDTLNHPDFPTSGRSLMAEYLWVQDFDADPGIDASTNRYLLTGAQAFGFGSWGGVVRAERGSSTDTGNVLQSLFFLGGFRNLSAYSERALPNNDYRYASVEAYRRLTASDAVGSIPIYVGGLVEYAEFTFDLDGLIWMPDPAFSVTGYAAVNTLLGPAYLGLSAGDRGNKSVFLYVGRNF
ncbi:patatin-like phospholipase family protein [Hyphobacterium sp. SN044]|uniref:patatin-like phospholipase family protein n=1 Tax=Hyphobacterium sp. SN044 TaxID=2912575 RepID=UPI001F0205C8|nr:patatin-like phospholipase family protein [Hyphobacterium sp. SN044]MCF8880251.1 patatin-like phospholipase family protein [Hyphobacterium sp. SN044]